MLEQVPRSRLGKLVQVVFLRMYVFNDDDDDDDDEEEENDADGDDDDGHEGENLQVLSFQAGSHQHILSLCDTYSLVDNEYFFDRWAGVDDNHDKNYHDDYDD